MAISINNLSQKLKEIQKEIEEFQNSCKHKYQHIKFDGKNNARWYCQNCDKMVRIPSPKELDDWVKG
jgi:late competence protein required for DNA uptake (superfamily II DNA/RNA helicase)